MLATLLVSCAASGPGNAAGGEAEPGCLLAENGQSRYVIYCPADAPPTVKDAAGQVQRVLKKATGVDLLLVNRRGPKLPRHVR